MPYHDEEYPDQPLCQSVLLFCCKGMIEGIMVILFFWLLVQVLFTKQLEVQTTASQLQYEELGGDLIEYPSTFTSPAPSEVESTSVPFQIQATAASEQKEQPKSYFSLRRLSTPPLTSPVYRPIDPSHVSLPSFPKLGLLSKTCKALQRRGTGLITQDVVAGKGLSCPPQIFILLQYLTLSHRIKATVLRADGLDGLVRSLAAAEYQVVINLHHEGVVISSRETKGGSCSVWNASFLFDLPPGDISQLPLMLEFIIMQHQVLPEHKVLGRVQVGADAADAGRAHWRDMCSLHGEQTRWHTVQPEPL
ncbi:uncharacterized protein V6R79_009193 [Siganus canaliculatus]